MTKIAVTMTLPSSTMKITGLRTSVRGSSFRKESPDRRARTISRVNRLSERGGHRAVSSSSARLSSSTLTPGSPKKPMKRPSVASSISSWTRSSGRPRTSATARRLQLGVGRRDVRVDAGAGGGDGVDGDVADLEAGVVRAFELEDRLRLLVDRRREVGVRRPEVREARPGRVVVDGRGPRVEVLGLRERLRGEPRADHLAVALDQAPVGLLGEGDLGEAGHERRVGEAEDGGEDDRRDDRARRARASGERLHERAERERREDHQPGGEDDDGDEQDRERRAVGPERARPRRARSSSARASPRARARRSAGRSGRGRGRPCRSAPRSPSRRSRRRRCRCCSPASRRRRRPRRSRARRG